MSRESRAQGNVSAAQSPCTEHSSMCGGRPWRNDDMDTKVFQRFSHTCFSSLFMPTLTSNAWLQMPRLSQPGSEFGYILHLSPHFCVVLLCTVASQSASTSSSGGPALYVGADSLSPGEEISSVSS